MKPLQRVSPMQGLCWEIGLRPNLRILAGNDEEALGVLQLGVITYGFEFYETICRQKLQGREILDFYQNKAGEDIDEMARILSTTPPPVLLEGRFVVPQDRWDDICREQLHEAAGQAIADALEDPEMRSDPHRLAEHVGRVVFVRAQALEFQKNPPPWSR